MEEKRRNFLKFLLTGTGVFFFGNLLGYNFFKKEARKTKEKIGNFIVSSDSNEIIFSDSGGEDILVIDKNTF